MAAGPVMLAEKWDAEKTDPKGWWMSEKLDGVRAKCNFYSRNNGRFYAPQWFKDQLPKGVALDGELWGGRRQFQRTVGIVKTHVPVDDDWKYLSYMVFDAPDHKAGFEDRLRYCKKILKNSSTAQVIGMCKCKGKSHLLEKLAAVEEGGGEGLMLRKPNSEYENRRSPALLKVKTFFDEEGIVVGHKKGSGRNSHRMGALFVHTPDGREFKVGTGFTDAQRDKPPKAGTVITYRYQELSNAGNPRFPSFVGERIDMDWDAYCATYTPPEKNKPGPLKKKHTVLFDEDDDDVVVPAGSSALETVVKTVQKRLARASQSIIADEVESDVEEEKEGGKPACKYGAACFRTNPSHLAAYAHPAKTEAKAAPAVGDKRKRDEEEDDFVDELPAKKQKTSDAEEEKEEGSKATTRRRVAPEDDKIPCRFGESCYDMSKTHRKRFSHPNEAVIPVAEDEDDADLDMPTVNLQSEGMAVPATSSVAEDTNEVPATKQTVKQVVTRFFLVHTALPSASEDDSNDNGILEEIELHLDQDVTLGRGSHSWLSDNRLSRRQLRVIARSVPTDSYATSLSSVVCLELEPLGLNYCLLRKEGQAAFSTKLKKGHLYHVNNGDQVALLPDQSVGFSVEVRYSFA